MFLILLQHIFYILFFIEITRKIIDFKNKKIIVLGGSSGLGLELCKLIKSLGGSVTVVGRNKEKLKKLENEFTIKNYDITEEFIKDSCTYDYIFCCVGQSTPKYFTDTSDEEIKKMLLQNLYSPVNALKLFYKYNTKPFTYTVIASSLALYSIPGYSVYSATKAGLLNLFNAAKLETKKVQIKIYLTSTIYTEAFEIENRIKPQLTKSFESTSFNKYCSPEQRAFDLIRSMGYRNIIASDIFTYLTMINKECECVKDYVFLPVAVIYNLIFNLYCKYFFRELLK
ncbi:hypothetical protein H311_03345 [Anncaliia algerae PRA109]|nr:hypothetical protein H311_03345 [Anncaliia algerae PRA109]